MTDGSVSIRARIREASNATFLAELDGASVVYKPVEGERPLWDFPDGTLAGREVAAHLVSEAFGWGVVPPTWIGDGPFGPGMVQRWQDVDPSRTPSTWSTRRRPRRTDRPGCPCSRPSTSTTGP